MTQAPQYGSSASRSSSPQKGASQLMATRPWSPSTPEGDMCLHTDGCRWGRVGGRGSPVAALGSIACPYVVAYRGIALRLIGEQS
jgi:hypothetical protein